MIAKAPKPQYKADAQAVQKSVKKKSNLMHDKRIARENFIRNQAQESSLKFLLKGKTSFT